jgi:hypothetical protein
MTERHIQSDPGLRHSLLQMGTATKKGDLILDEFFTKRTDN